MTSASALPDPDATRRQVTVWFFDHYLPLWMGNASGREPQPPEFIFDYWSVPLHVASEAGTLWLTDEAAVLRFLTFNLGVLKASNYDHTVILDRQVGVYHDHGASIDMVCGRGGGPTAAKSSAPPCTTRSRGRRARPARASLAGAWSACRSSRRARR